jgi:hypothetical protein
MATKASTTNTAIAPTLQRLGFAAGRCFFPNLALVATDTPSEKGPATCRASEHSKSERLAYFCCSLGLSAGFGGLPWVCCCGVTGAVAGFCGSDAEFGMVVMAVSLHEKTKVEVSVLYVAVYVSPANKSK